MPAPIFLLIAFISSFVERAATSDRNTCSEHRSRDDAMKDSRARAQASAALSLLAVSMLTNPAGVLGATTPAIVTALVTELGQTLRSATMLVAIEFVTMTLAIMAAPLLLCRIGGRVLAIASWMLMLAGQLGTILNIPVALAVARGATGLGEGALYGLALAVLGRSAKPDRAFGVVVFANQVVSAVLLAFAGWAHQHDPRSGILQLITAFQLLTGFFILAIDRQRVSSREPTPGSLGGLLVIAPALLAIFLFAVAFGTIWPLAASIGEIRNVPTGEINSALAVAGIGGIAGAAAAVALGNRAGRTIPLLTGSVAMAIALVGVVVGPLAIAAPAALFLWSFLVPYYLGTIAMMDGGARFMGIAGAMLPSGIAAGQFFASCMSGTIPSTLGICAAMLQVASAIALSFYLWMSKSDGRNRAGR
ncbi:hypothetical protein HL653_05825 [Sphingomonas sp. AP4-R1]|uniref:MFS transporter n=1 Tax=Sphingomonas sp. AP4-R1 TaxID=2735134 RepID=UPI001493987F|nr:MFS transporter [Sphingomonas sp. AP4-R1]QJU57372.1 hypothetical protein HL653_05825 [Sphingomonas sp. AP4-R1]